MTIYLVIVDDTHAEIEVIPYYNKQEAIDYAMEIAEENCLNVFDLEIDAIEGWIFFCKYSSESSVHVIEKEIE